MSAVSVTESLYISAFFVGLLGGVHCVGMCGGIVGALSIGGHQAGTVSWGRILSYQLGYNLGRMTSYVIAGALVGGIGLIAANMFVMHQAQQLLSIVAGLFMIALGLYLAGWWRGLARIEQAGGVIWKKIEPFGRRLIPVRSPLQAMMLGMVWGWLPCGLVYSILIWAIAAGGPLEGGLLLLSFALGTLPNLLLMGVFAAKVSRFVSHPVVRAVAGILVMMFGVMAIARGFID